MSEKTTAPCVCGHAWGDHDAKGCALCICPSYLLPSAPVPAAPAPCETCGKCGQPKNHPHHDADRWPGRISTNHPYHGFVPRNEMTLDDLTGYRPPAAPAPCANPHCVQGYMCRDTDGEAVLCPSCHPEVYRVWPAPAPEGVMCARCGHAEGDHDGYGGLCDGLGGNASRTVCGCTAFMPDPDALDDGQTRCAKCGAVVLLTDVHTCAPAPEATRETDADKLLDELVRSIGDPAAFRVARERLRSALAAAETETYNWKARYVDARQTGAEALAKLRDIESQLAAERTARETAERRLAWLDEHGAGTISQHPEHKGEVVVCFFVPARPEDVALHESGGGEWSASDAIGRAIDAALAARAPEVTP